MLSSFSPNCLGYKMIFGLSKIAVVICIFYIAVLTRSKAIGYYSQYSKSKREAKSLMHKGMQVHGALSPKGQ